MRIKKAQSAASAAVLVLLLGAFILIYLLFLPPDYRDALLEDRPLPETGTYNSLNYNSGAYQQGLGNLAYNKTILTQIPGRIDYLKTTEFDHPIPAINLYTATNAVVIKQEPSLFVKSSAFDQQFRDIFFTVPDQEHTNNIMLSGQIVRAQGRLIIKLNDNIIFEGYVTQLQPIPIDKGFLKPENRITFEVSSVGWQFWSTNEYQLQNVQIVGDYTDISQQASRNTFTVSDTEKFNVDTVQLEYYPDCSESKVGRLEIYVNNQNIFNSIPACTQMNVIDFSSEFLSAGNNNIDFKTERGYYSVYQINVHTRLKKQTLPTYYFELPEQLFTTTLQKDDKYYYGPLCGEVDGICPDNCDEDLDKDCCFASGAKAWCDVVPDDEGDRCKSIIQSSQCNKCQSGYENEFGKAVQECREQCGDDFDGTCPVGCSKYVDRDCCFVENKQNYWCSDIPKYGLEGTCKQSITQSQCSVCPTGYETKSPTGFVCVTELNKKTTAVPVLRPDYKVILKFRFFDDDQKKAAKVFVNGHRFEIDTYQDEYSRDISIFVVDKNNGIKIEPITSPLEIIKFDVELEQR